MKHQTKLAISESKEDAEGTTCERPIQQGQALPIISRSHPSFNSEASGTQALFSR